jgi:hypothetical protein
MAKVLNGFKSYEDYLSYSTVLFGWLKPKQQKEFYNYLLKVQRFVDPVTLMRRMKADIYAKITG